MIETSHPPSDSRTNPRIYPPTNPRHKRTLVRMLLDLLGETIKPHKTLVVVFLISLLGLSLCQGAFVLGTKGLMRALFDQGQTSSLFLRDLVPFKFGVKTGHHGNLSELFGPAYSLWGETLSGVLDRQISVQTLSWIVPIYLLVVGVAQAISHYFYQVSQQRLGLYAAAHFREKLFSAIVKLPYLTVQHRSPGQWMSIVMNDVVYLQNRLTELSTALFKDSVLILVSIGLLWVIHWPSALVISSCIPLMAWSMGRAGKRVTQYAESFQRALGRIAAAVHDVRQRFDFVFGQLGQQRENAYFGWLSDHYFQTMRKSLWIRAFMVSSLEWIGFMFFAGLLFLVGSGLLLAFDGHTLVQLMVALGLLMRPVKELGEQIARYHETKGILKSSLEVFRQVEEMGQSNSRYIQKSSPSLSNIQDLGVHNLGIQHMSVAIDGKTLFNAHSLELSSSQSVAVIGPSGAGKSTFIKSFAGLIEPSLWEASLSWDDLVKRVAFVSQDPFFFHGSIRSNLVYGSDTHEPLNDQLSDQEKDKDLWKVLAEVGLEQEVRDFEHQLETPIFAFAHNVSGGQLQRLVIARALMRNRPILILDEATSAIDSEAEGSLIRGIIKKAKEKNLIVLMVTHRLQWLDLFDKVLFVESGRVLHSGSHKQLLSLPRYQQFCQEESDV